MQLEVSHLDFLSQLWSKFKSPSQSCCSECETSPLGALGVLTNLCKEGAHASSQGSITEPRAMTLLVLHCIELLTCATPETQAANLNGQHLIQRAGDETAEGVF